MLCLPSCHVSRRSQPHQPHAQAAPLERTAPLRHHLLLHPPQLVLQFLDACLQCNSSVWRQYGASRLSPLPLPGARPGPAPAPGRRCPATRPQGTPQGLLLTSKLLRHTVQCCCNTTTAVPGAAGARLLSRRLLWRQRRPPFLGGPVDLAFAILLSHLGGGARTGGSVSGVREVLDSWATQHCRACCLCADGRRRECTAGRAAAPTSRASPACRLRPAPRVPSLPWASSHPWW